MNKFKFSKNKKNNKTSSLFVKSGTTGPSKYQDLNNILLNAILFADADPEYVKRIEAILGRSLPKCKDTEDYNLDLFSSWLDKTALKMNEAGLRDFKPGEHILLESSLLSNKELKENLDAAKMSKKYQMFPWSVPVMDELRAKHLLQTESKDTTKGLLSDLESLSSKFMSKADWKILSDAISSARERFKQVDIEFPMPLEGREQGVLSTPESVDKISADANFKVDVRKDNHDILALKALVLVMEGLSVESLNIAPGFFHKYMPELGQLGVRGVVLSVEKDRLKKIELVKFPKSEANDKEFVKIPFSPVEAATVLALHGGTPKADKKFYVVVDGCVAAPDNKYIIGYTERSVNNKRVKAGETFLFSQDVESKTVLATRLYFTPHAPKELHPMYQTGSVVFGSNDQSFNSCASDENHEFSSAATALDFIQYFEENPAESQPAVLAYKLEKLGNHQDDNLIPTLFSEENLSELYDVTDSLYGENAFSITKWLGVLENMSDLFTLKNSVEPLLSNYAPLTSRWFILDYLKDGAGLTKNIQPTFYRRISQKTQQLGTLAMIENLNKVIRFKELIKKGLTTEQAARSVYGDEWVDSIKEIK